MKHSNKIKTPAQLYEMVGVFSSSKIVLASGVFDLVHPGHIRHLMYAKEKADILIVGVTSDRFVSKGEDRPHVPQDLRAMNLAVLEFVDYVVIDDNKKPLSLIGLLQPDYYCKGYEYSPENRETNIEEVELVTRYGGEVLYTPGDIVYSSSKLIDAFPVDIKFDKLLALMHSEDITFDKLRFHLNLMKYRKIHVVGDTIVDSQTNCTMIGAQAKTPTISALFENKWDFVGGAGVVSKHLKAAGADVVFTTVLGNDDLRLFVCNDLEENGIMVKAVIDSTRQTTNKNVMIVDGYRILKVDTVDNRTISNGILDNIRRCIEKSTAEAMIFSDFRHGIFNRRTINELTGAIPKGIFKVADSQVATRWGNITEFKGFDLVTPNEREARFSLADQDSGIRALASDLYDKVECGTLMLKLGSTVKI